MRPILPHALPAAVFALVTVLFCFEALLEPDRAPTVEPELYARYEERLEYNDTGPFLEHLTRSAEALAEGRVHLPIGDYDVPPSYLLGAGGLIVATGAPAIVAHNWFFVAVFFLNGLFAYVFLAAMTERRALRVSGAVVYQTSNYVFFQHYIGHMHQVEIEWIPLVLASLLHIARREQSIRWAVVLGLAFGMQVLSSPYYTLFSLYVAGPVFLVSCCVASWRRGELAAHDLRTIGACLLGAAVLSAAVSGFYLLRRLGAPPRAFPVETAMWSPYVLDHPLELLDPTQPTFFVGLPALALLACAVPWMLRRREPKTVALGCTLLASFGMMLPAYPASPYWLFHHLFPLADRLRVPGRFFPFFLLSLVALLVAYWSHLQAGWSPRRRRAMEIGAATAFVCLNWLLSPWALGGSLLGAVGRWIDP